MGLSLSPTVDMLWDRNNSCWVFIEPVNIVHISTISVSIAQYGSHPQNYVNRIVPVKSAIINMVILQIVVEQDMCLGYCLWDS